MLDNLNLVHMNGRVYDQVVGRFISADPIIQAPGHTQSFNRHSYVFNNPLVFTDPSGFACAPSEPQGCPFYDYGMAIPQSMRDWVNEMAAFMLDPVPGRDPDPNTTRGDRCDESSSCANPTVQVSAQGLPTVNMAIFGINTDLLKLLAEILDLNPNLTANQAQHEAGVRQQMAAMEALGFEILGVNTYAVVSGLPYPRYYDFVVAKGGDFFGVEVKTTRTGRWRLNAKQVAFDAEVVAAGATAPSLPGAKINGVIYRGVNFNTQVDAKWAQFELLTFLEWRSIPFHPSN